ncbi:MAG: chromate transporter, partial [Burkholderiaceae bacterium]
IPSCTLTWAATRWAHRNRELLAVRAFKQGMAPVVVALLVATGWILATGAGYDLTQWPLWTIAVVSTLLVWKTRIHLLWLLGAGGLLGALGWV